MKVFGRQQVGEQPSDRGAQTHYSASLMAPRLQDVEESLLKEETKESREDLQCAKAPHQEFPENAGFLRPSVRGQEEAAAGFRAEKAGDPFVTVQEIDETLPAQKEIREERRELLGLGLHPLVQRAEDRSEIATLGEQKAGQRVLDRPQQTQSLFSDDHRRHQDMAPGMKKPQIVRNFSWVGAPSHFLLGRKDFLFHQP